jgi:hypothetical protein
MAVPRPVLIALLGLAMLVAVFMATRNSQSESVTPPVNPPQAATPRKSAPAPTDKGNRPEARRTTAEKPQPPQAKPAERKPKPADDVPPQVRAAAEALAKNQVVVFFFTKPGAADDTGARVAVRSLEGMKRVEVFKADIAEVGAYRPMLSQLEISQVPAMAIVRPGRQAVLLQGFVDAGTLRQHVADALR